MKTKGLVLNFILVFLSTSASLLSISLVLVLIPLLPTKQNKIKMIERKRTLEFDYPAKIISAADGYIPPYYPKKTRYDFLGSRYYPIGTLPNTKTFYCNEGYGLITFKSDRFGLRIMTRIGMKSNKGTTFFIGDSFTQGACIGTEFVVTELFADLLNANALNLGSEAMDPTNTLRF